MVSVLPQFRADQNFGTKADLCTAAEGLISRKNTFLPRKKTPQKHQYFHHKPFLPCCEPLSFAETKITIASL